jgi:uncharacterized protein YciI
VSDSRVLRRIFGPKNDEMMGRQRKQHNNRLHDLYSLPNIIRIIKSMRMKWVEHVTQKGEENRLWVIGRKVKEKGTPRKTKT